MSKKKSDKIIRVAINGFGRIGRQAFKIALNKPEMEIVGINDLSSPEVLAGMLKYDSNYGRFSGEIGYDTRHLVVNEKKYPIFAEKEPRILPWKLLDVDVVLECTGRFTDGQKAGGHLEAGAKKVIISAPAKDEGATFTLVLGVNEHEYKGQSVISNASCTTNCIAPVAGVLEKEFGIAKILMTTIHSYTAEQNLVDGPPPGGHSTDMRRARAAGINIVPTTTGAAISAAETIPSLKGKFNGLSVRVPTPVGSLSDFSVLLKRRVTKEQVNQVIINASESRDLKGILGVTTEPLVSSDIVGSSYSAIVDLNLTQVVDGDLVKIIAWYDNEFGYANRLVEAAILIV